MPPPSPPADVEAAAVVVEEEEVAVGEADGFMVIDVVGIVVLWWEGIVRLASGK